MMEKIVTTYLTGHVRVQQYSKYNSAEHENSDNSTTYNTNDVP